MEEVPDVLEDKVAGLLHLEGEGVAVEPGSDVRRSCRRKRRARSGKQQPPSTTERP